MALFGPRFMFDAGTTDWMFDTYAWALTQFGSDRFYKQTPLILPTDTFFPDKLDESADIAETLFLRVREHAGMSNWPCRLVAQEEDAEVHVGPALMIQGAPSGPAGTILISGGDTPEIEITYNPSQKNRPESLIATFSHELAHYLIHSTSVEPPGGPDFEEHATDLVAVFMGFGVFLANSAFSFSQFTDVDSQGWVSHAQGYLSEPELTYGLAIFLHLKGLDRREVEPYLDRSLHKTLKTALREMRHLEAEVSHLKAIESGRGPTADSP